MRLSNYRIVRGKICQESGSRGMDRGRPKLAENKQNLDKCMAKGKKNGSCRVKMGDGEGSEGENQLGKRGRPHKNRSDSKEANEEVTEDKNVSENLEDKRKRRGRPPKRVLDEKEAKTANQSELSFERMKEDTVKARERPPKKVTQGEKVSLKAILDDKGSQAEMIGGKVVSDGGVGIGMVKEEAREEKNVKRRGRPPKKVVQGVDVEIKREKVVNESGVASDVIEEGKKEERTVKRRGRPVKNSSPSQGEEMTIEEIEGVRPNVITEKKVVKRRGRPAKKAVDKWHEEKDEKVVDDKGLEKEIDERTANDVVITEEKVVKRRGRPPKKVDDRKGLEKEEDKKVDDKGLAEEPIVKRRGRPPKKADDKGREEEKDEEAVNGCEMNEEPIGRPPKKVVDRKGLEKEEDKKIVDDKGLAEEPIVKRRGRPPKKADGKGHEQEKDTPSVNGIVTTEEKAVKRRGRPPKKADEKRLEEEKDEKVVNETGMQAPKQEEKVRRGRPPKKVVSDQRLEEEKKQGETNSFERDQSPKKRVKTTNKDTHQNTTIPHSGKSIETDQVTDLKAGLLSLADKTNTPDSSAFKSTSQKSSKQANLQPNTPEQIQTPPNQKRQTLHTKDGINGNETTHEDAIQLKPDTTKISDFYDVVLEPRERLNFYALNVGLGNFLICTIGLKAVIFDAGSLEFLDPQLRERKAESVLKPGVEILKGKEIVAVVITHPHWDHYSLLVSALQRSGHILSQVPFICGGFRGQMEAKCGKWFHLPQSTIFTIDPENHDSEEPPFVRDQQYVDKMKQNIEKILNDGFADSHVSFEVFLPRRVTQDVKDPNNIHISSMILVKMTYMHRSILITGDAVPETIENLHSKEDDKTSPFGDFDIYVIPHHGSSRNSRHGVFGGVVPKLLICSADAFQKKCYDNGLPRHRTFELLAEDIPEVAPEHVIFTWDHYPKEPLTGKMPPPMEMPTKMPIYTTGQNHFLCGGETFEGIHVHIDPLIGNEKGTATLELVEDGVLRSYSIDNYHGFIKQE